jgi:heat shock protein HtpX
MTEAPTVSFAIETEVTSAYYEELLNYTYQKYLQPQSESYANVKRDVVDGFPVLDFTFMDHEAKWNVDVRIKTGKPIQVLMTPSSAVVPQIFLDRLKEDIIIVMQYFEEHVRRSTLYFAWVQGREVVPEKSPFRRARVFERIFFGNILFLFILLFAVSLFLVFLIGIELTAIFIVVSQLMTVIFSDKLIGTMSDWKISGENPTVHILQYHLPEKERESFLDKYTREKLLQMKKEIHDKTLAVGKPIDCATASGVMSQYGLECSPESMATKVVNVHELVKKTTEKFNLPMPKIALSNTIVANAAAAGPSPKRGIILLTTGLLVQLNEEETMAVLGHELSHLNARDPFVLFGLVSGEYLFRIFVLLPYTSIFQYFGFLYLIFILGLIYFIAKFFEARADLDSAFKIGNPKILAGALRKIGFRRLQFERSAVTRVSDWITWDPHPPIYFRVQRLEKLDPNTKVEHRFIQSAKDCIRGFFAAF